MFEIKFKKLTDKELADRYSRVKPLKRTEDGKLMWIESFSDIQRLKDTAFLWDAKYVREVKDDELVAYKGDEFIAFATWAYYGFFKPTLEEVLSQIDPINLASNRLDPIVAFEIIDAPECWDDIHKTELHSAILNAGYHIFKVKLYTRSKNFTGYPEGV